MQMVLIGEDLFERLLEVETDEGITGPGARKMGGSGESTRKCI